MQPAPPTPADRLSALIVRLVSAVFARRVGAHLGFIPVLLVGLITDRLRGVSQRFRRLADRVQAGWVYQPKPRAPRPAPAKPPADRPPHTPPDRQAPTFANFVRQARLIPGHDLETIGREFRQLLADPAMQAVMAAAPRPAWQILRPLCRMTGTPRPDILAPPPRPKRPKKPKRRNARKAPKRAKPQRAGWMGERLHPYTADFPHGIPDKLLPAKRRKT